ncbi:MAG: tetratricopeptide repeat protein [Anaerolineales bacterium]
MREIGGPASEAERGLAAYRAGRLEEAVQALILAESGYARMGDRVLQAEMANNRAVVLLALGKASEAKAAATGTEGIFLQAGDLSRAGKAVGNLAAALEAEGDPAGAESAYRRAADLFTQAGDEESRSQTQRALSQLLLRRGRHLEAVAAMDQGLPQKPRSWTQRLVRWLLRLPVAFLGR